MSENSEITKTDTVIKTDLLVGHKLHGKNLEEILDAEIPSGDQVDEGLSAVDYLANSPHYVKKYLKNEQRKQDMNLRTEHGNSIKEISVGYLSFVCLILLLVGTKYFYLSDPVLITLLGSTTTTVIGLYVIVVHNVFPRKNKQ